MPNTVSPGAGSSASGCCPVPMTQDYADVIRSRRSNSRRNQRNHVGGDRRCRRRRRIRHRQRRGSSFTPRDRAWKGSSWLCRSEARRAGVRSPLSLHARVDYREPGALLADRIRRIRAPLPRRLLSRLHEEAPGLRMPESSGGSCKQLCSAIPTVKQWLEYLEGRQVAQGLEADDKAVAPHNRWL